MNFTDLQGLSAGELLLKCNLENTVPVDLNIILKKYGVSAQAFDFDSMETLQSQNVKVLGAAVENGKQAAIFYNKSDVKDGHRYRFTIAHELAHFCLHGGGPHVDFRIEELSQDEKEIAANTFAGELLIPEKQLKKNIDDLIFPSVRLLADIFAVSENVMVARLKHLNISDGIFGYNM